MSYLDLDFLLASRILLAVLLHFVWQALLICLWVALVHCLIASKASSRYATSVAGLLLIFAAPILTAGVYVANPSLVDVSLVSDPLMAGTTADLNAGPADDIMLWSQIKSSLHRAFCWFDQFRFVWLSVWLLGCATLSSRLAISLSCCLRLRRFSVPLPPAVELIADSVKSRLNMSARIVVRASADVTQAIATGVVRPMVLIPLAWLTQLSTNSLEAIIAHELAHVRRLDLWVNLLQRSAETVFFFHPLVWWISRTINREREICCDEVALKCTNNRLAYAETLAWVAELKQLNSSGLQFGTAFRGDKQMNLLRRVRLILEPSVSEGPTAVRSLAVFGCLAATLTFASLAMSVTAVVPVSPQENQDHHKVEKKLRIVNGEDAKIIVSANDDDESGQKHKGPIVWRFNADEQDQDSTLKNLHEHLMKLDTDAGKNDALKALHGHLSKLGSEEGHEKALKALHGHSLKLGSVEGNDGTLKALHGHLLKLGEVSGNAVWVQEDEMNKSHKQKEGNTKKESGVFEFHFQGDKSKQSKIELANKLLELAEQLSASDNDSGLTSGEDYRAVEGKEIELDIKAIEKEIEENVGDKAHHQLFEFKARHHGTEDEEHADEDHNQQRIEVRVKSLKDDDDDDDDNDGDQAGQEKLSDEHSKHAAHQDIFIRKANASQTREGHEIELQMDHNQQLHDVLTDLKKQIEALRSDVNELKSKKPIKGAAIYGSDQLLQKAKAAEGVYYLERRRADAAKQRATAEAGKAGAVALHQLQIAKQLDLEKKAVADLKAMSLKKMEEAMKLKEHALKNAAADQEKAMEMEVVKLKQLQAQMEKLKATMEMKEAAMKKAADTEESAKAEKVKATSDANEAKKTPAKKKKKDDDDGDE